MTTLAYYHSSRCTSEGGVSIRSMARYRVNRRVVIVLGLVLSIALLSQLFLHGPISKSGELDHHQNPLAMNS